MAALRREARGGKSGLHRAAEWVTPTPREGRIRATETSLRREPEGETGNLSAEQDQIDFAGASAPLSGPPGPAGKAGAEWVGC